MTKKKASPPSLKSYVSKYNIQSFFARKRRGAPKRLTPEEREDAMKNDLLNKSKLVRTSERRNKKNNKNTNERTKSSASDKKKDSNNPDDDEPAKKKTRRNYSHGEDYEKLKRAIDCWENKRDEYFNEDGKPKSFETYCKQFDIPVKTFRHYVCGPVEKRRVLGSSVGRKPMISKEDQGFVCDVLARADRGNEGKNRKEAIDLIQDLAPELSRKQASRALTVHILEKENNVKKNIIKSQASTTSRSSITVDQQFRWHNTYENCLNILRNKNVGKCKKSGKSFGEVIQHFIIGGDESNFMASHNGDAYVIGSVGKKKHEKNVADSRCSITAYRTGTVVGDTGPTMILLAGKQKRKHYSDKFLINNRAAQGSTIIMTETAFMTTDAWVKMPPNL